MPVEGLKIWGCPFNKYRKEKGFPSVSAKNSGHVSPGPRLGRLCDPRPRGSKWWEELEAKSTISRLYNKRDNPNNPAIFFYLDYFVSCNEYRGFNL